MPPIIEQDTPSDAIPSARNQSTPCATADEALMRQADQVRGNYYQIVRRDIALACGEVPA